MLKDAWRPMKNLFEHQFIKKDIPQEIKNLQKRFNKKQQEGFDFHQTVFKENETVRNWVLQENYFNYNLPENHD